MEVSWEGYGNSKEERQWIPHDQLAEGTLKDNWDRSYGKAVVKAKQELLKRIEAHAQRLHKQYDLAKVVFLTLPEVARNALANWSPNLTDGDPGQRLDLESRVVEQARSAKETRKRNTNAYACWNDVVGISQWCDNLLSSSSDTESSDLRDEVAKIARRPRRFASAHYYIETTPRDTPMPKTLEQAFISKY